MYFSVWADETLYCTIPEPGPRVWLSERQKKKRLFHFQVSSKAVSKSSPEDFLKIICIEERLLKSLLTVPTSLPPPETEFDEGTP